MTHFYVSLNLKPRMETFHADLFCGAETGLLKAINIQNSCWKNIGHLTQCDKESEICAMCWGNQSQSQFCVATKNRKLQTFSKETEKGWSLKSEWDINGSVGKIKGVVPLLDKYITADESGLINLWKSDGESSLQIKTLPDLCCLAQNPSNVNHIAVGGKENELKLYDISSDVTQPIFQAKNVRHDWLNLRVPVWILGIKFVSSNNNIVTCTGYHHVRVYDPKIQRRPVMSMEFDEYPITSMDIVHSNEKQVVVGNTQGKMALIDLRKKQMVQCYKGFAGGIRSIQCHTDLPFIASCSLDRFVRIHNLDSKELLHKFYLKSRLNCLLLSDDLSINEDKKHEKVTGDERLKGNKKKANDVNDDDEVWKDIPLIQTKTVKRKQSEDIDSSEKDSEHSHVKKSKRKKDKKMTVT